MTGYYSRILRLLFASIHVGFVAAAISRADFGFSVAFSSGCAVFFFGWAFLPRDDAA